MRDGVRRFERGDDAFELREQLKRFERLVVRCRCVLDAPRVVEECVLGADGRVVESGGDRMRRGYLPVLVLEDVTERALQHAGTTAARAFETRGVLSEFFAHASRFDSDHSDARVSEERVEQPD